MKPMFSAGMPVPWSRVGREHRTALLPLGIALAVNVIVLLAVVLPLSRTVNSNEARAATIASEEAAALEEQRLAEASREGQTRAAADLDTFYKQVLPADVAVARRTLSSKILKLAEAHDVDYRRGGQDTQTVRESMLEQYKYSFSLTGDYDDLRALIYELETSPEFVIIDNIVLVQGQDANAPLALSMEISTYYRAPVRQESADGR